MLLHGRNYTRRKLAERVGHMAQIGGTRHYVLNEGRSKGVSAVDVDTGARFRFTALPDCVGGRRVLTLGIAFHMMMV